MEKIEQNPAWPKLKEFIDGSDGFTSDELREFETGDLKLFQITGWLNRNGYEKGPDGVWAHTGRPLRKPKRKEEVGATAANARPQGPPIPPGPTDLPKERLKEIEDNLGAVPINPLDAQWYRILRVSGIRADLAGTMAGILANVPPDSPQEIWDALNEFTTTNPNHRKTAFNIFIRENRVDLPKELLKVVNPEAAAKQETPERPSSEGRGFGARKWGVVHGTIVPDHEMGLTYYEAEAILKKEQESQATASPGQGQLTIADLVAVMDRNQMTPADLINVVGNIQQMTAQEPPAPDPTVHTMLNATLDTQKLLIDELRAAREAQAAEAAEKRHQELMTVIANSNKPQPSLMDQVSTVMGGLEAMGINVKSILERFLNPPAGIPTNVGGHEIVMNFDERLKWEELQARKEMIATARNYAPIVESALERLLSAEPEQPEPQSGYQCQNCGSKMAEPAPDALTIACESCGQQHLTEKGWHVQTAQEAHARPPAPEPSQLPEQPKTEPPQPAVPEPEAPHPDAELEKVAT